MFKRKSEEEKFLEKVKKKKAEIKKLEEDLVKMVKFGIKDGKLVPKDNVQDTQESGIMNSVEPKTILKNNDVDNNIPNDELYRKMVETEVQKMQMNNPQPRMPQQEQEKQYMYEQPQMPRPVVQPQYRQMPKPEPVIVAVRIVATDGMQFTAQVPEEYLQKFFEDINTAMAEQTPFQLDNSQVINGRHIIYYGF